MFPFVVRAATVTPLGRAIKLPTRSKEIDADVWIGQLSAPSTVLIEKLAELDGDIMILGAGGKIGPSVALMARRACDAAGHRRRVIAVSRFTDPGLPKNLESSGIEIIRGDLADRQFVESLPNAKNIVYLVGMKFGGTTALTETWATNVYVAGLVASHFTNSRIVALSTGNVYGLSAVSPGTGSLETDAPQPIGEYAMSALGRERIFQHFSRRNNTTMTILRLNYATELRYGVLVDLAQQIYRGETVPLEMGYFNVIWQRDACDMILRSLGHVATPPRVLNITGPERVSTRSVCEYFAQQFDRPVHFSGTESPTALLSNAAESMRLFNPPQTTLEEMLARTADWIQHGGETWGKPTRFQVRDGSF